MIIFLLTKWSRKIYQLQHRYHEVSACVASSPWCDLFWFKAYRKACVLQGFQSRSDLGSLECTIYAVEEYLLPAVWIFNVRSVESSSNHSVYVVNALIPGDQSHVSVLDRKWGTLSKTPSSNNATVCLCSFPSKIPQLTKSTNVRDFPQPNSWQPLKYNITDRAHKLNPHFYHPTDRVFSVKAGKKSKNFGRCRTTRIWKICFFDAEVFVDKQN